MIWRAPERALPIFGELSMCAEENPWRAAGRIEENEREREWRLGFRATVRIEENEREREWRLGFLERGSSIFADRWGSGQNLPAILGWVSVGGPVHMCRRMVGCNC